jgi:hypothetical protein
MKIRFQADADLNQIILSAVLRREPSIGFQTALAAEIQGTDDPGVLARAAQDGRILVTPYGANTQTNGMILFSNIMTITAFRNDDLDTTLSPSGDRPGRLD